MSMARARGVSSIDQTEIRFLVEKNADGIIVVDDDGIVLFANPAAEQIFGRPSELLIGSPIGIPFIAGDTTEIAIHRPGGDRIDAEIRVVETTWEPSPGASCKPSRHLRAQSRGGTPEACGQDGGRWSAHRRYCA
jgi:PAS domain-containing protein